MPISTNLNCLVANDDNFQLMMLNLNLRKCNINVLLQAQNGLELYQFLLKNTENYRFDFIVLDLEMPIMNGYVTCQKICEFYSKDEKFFKNQSKSDIWEEINERPLIIACTGCLNESIELEAKSCGFDLAIQSPLSPEKIESCIKERLKARITNQNRIARSIPIKEELEEEEK